MASAPSSRPPARPADRERLILDHMEFVRALVRRYADRGEPAEDLVQAGMIGLINAADRFDPERGTDFRSFAAPTILGEIRRHFRDRTWAVRVPRPLKDDLATVSRAIDEIVAARGRSPTVAEVAAATRLSQERVLEALAARAAYRPASLARQPTDDAPEGERALAVEEEGFDEVDARLLVRRGLAALPPRERVIVHLRFDEGLFQSEIAARVGISQMHVSRLLARALERLRADAEAS
jgi:RNA polymerase sigma-B factor